MTADEQIIVAAIQMVSGASVKGNLQQAAILIEQAVADGARMCVLPEYFCFLGYADTDKLSLRESAGDGPIQAFVSGLAKKFGIWLVAGTIPLESPDPQRIYNACLVYDPNGKQQARYDKLHLFSYQRGDESYDESRSISPGKAQPVIFDWDFGRAVLGICYDLRFPEFFRAAGDVGLIVLPSAFTYATGSAHWEILLRARAIENQCYVIASAQGGRHENGRRTWGHSMLVDPWGEVQNCLYEGAGVVCGQIDRRRVESVRNALPALRHRVL